MKNPIAILLFSGIFLSCGEETKVEAIKFHLDGAEVSTDTTQDNICKHYQVKLDPAPDEDVDVNFETTSGTIYSDEACTTTTTSIKAAGGSDTVNLYYKNIISGTDTIKASADGVDKSLEVTSSYALIGSWQNSCTIGDDSQPYQLTYHFEASGSWYYDYSVYSDAACTTRTGGFTIGKEDTNFTYTLGDLATSEANVRQTLLNDSSTGDDGSITKTTTYTFSKVDGNTCYIVIGSDDENAYPSTFTTTSSNESGVIVLTLTKVE